MPEIYRKNTGYSNTVVVLSDDEIRDCIRQAFETNNTYWDTVCKKCPNDSEAVKIAKWDKLARHAHWYIDQKLEEKIMNETEKLK